MTSSRMFRMGLLSLILAISLACNLPFKIVLNDDAAAAQLTRTAVIAQATVLTPDLPEPKIITQTPEPTLTITETALPVNTATATPTITLTSTNTPPPTLTSQPTSVALPQRSGGIFYAQRLYTAPSIDGSWEEWGSTIYSASYVTYGAGKWTGADDLSSSFRVGWDSSYLYIAAKVKDDIYAQNASGQDMYLGDSLELLFDADLYSDFYGTSLSNDDHQLGFSPGNPDPTGEKGAVAWFPRGTSGHRTQVIIGAMKTDDGHYRVEVAIPWSILDAWPAAGRHYGFAFSVSDNDNTESNVQESMVSSTPGRKLLNPTTWGELILIN